jgi:tetratricopeptide (TPR) repeat protein
MYEENLAQGDGYYSMQDYEKALTCYLKALSIEPADVYLLCRIADIYQRKGNLSAARREWEKVLGHDAGNVEAQRRLKELLDRATEPPSG